MVVIRFFFLLSWIKSNKNKNKLTFCRMRREKGKLRPFFSHFICFFDNFH